MPLVNRPAGLGDDCTLTPTLAANEPMERTWSHPWHGDLLPPKECIHPCISPPRTPENSQSPNLRPTVEEDRILSISYGSTGELLAAQAGQPLSVKCRFSRALKSELARPTKLPVDNRYKRKAFLVAMDVELLRRVGQGQGLNAMQAAKIKVLARQCQCAKKVLLSNDGEVAVQLYPQHFPGGKAQVLLQVVVEASIDKTYWACFGNMESVTVVPGDELVPLPSKDVETSNEDSTMSAADAKA